MIRETKHRSDHRYDHADVIAELSATITAMLAQKPDLDQILSGAIEHLRRTFPLVGASIALLEDDRLVVSAVWGDHVDRRRGQPIREGADQLRRVVANDACCVLDGPAAPRGFADASMQSYLALPLRWKGSVGGVIEIGSSDAATFEEQHLAVFRHAGTILGSSIAVIGQMRDLENTIAIHERAARRLAAQYTVTKILVEAPTFMDAASALLETIGEQLGWEVGLMWCVQTDTQTLGCTATWVSPDAQPVKFLAASEQLQFVQGVGIPGRVWASRHACWVADVLQDTNFTRHALAAEANLHAAFAFPIQSHHNFFGVIEFFSHEIQTPDQELLHTTTALGHQLGQYIERRRAERARRESEQYTGAVLQSALDGLIGIDHTGRIMEWNPAAERIFGYRRADAVGRELAELVVPPSLRERHHQSLARYVATGVGHILNQRIELPALRADGSEFPVELTITRIPGDEPPRLLGYVRDITDRKRAEESIRFQARLLNVVEQAVIATAIDGSITYWNPFAEMLYGWSAAEVMNRNVLDITPAEQSREQAIEIMERLQAGESWSGELVVRRRDGTQFPALITDSPIFDGNGNVVGVVGISRDITAQKQSEQTQRFLAHASAILSISLDYKTTLQQVADLVVPEIADWCVVDLCMDDGSIQQMAVAHVDPAKVELARALRQRFPIDPNAPYGVSEVLRTGRSQLTQVIPDNQVAVAARNAEHYEILRSLRLRSAIVVPLLARGRSIGALSLMLAESGRHYNETDLAVAEDLAMRAAFAIDNARLYDEAQAAIRLRDEFLSIASHELKTPLTTVLGHTQALQRRMAREQTWNERDQRALRVIEEQSLRLNQQIATLLDVSRIELGQFQIRREPVDMITLVERAVSEIEPTLDRHTVQLDCADQPLIVQGDERLLDQVVQNLLGNAIKYSPRGGMVRVQVERDDTTVHISVSDQGMGIPESARPYLFQRFFRASNINSQYISGLGIGLYLIHEIVSEHGGSVDVQSTEDVGSTFTVHLPLDAADTHPASGTG